MQSRTGGGKLASIWQSKVMQQMAQSLSELICLVIPAGVEPAFPT